MARQLYASGIPFFLPLILKRLRVRNQIRSTHLPLFSGYVFLLAQAQERLVALATKRVVQSLRVADQEGLWRDLTQIHRLISTGAPITPEDKFASGSLVEIRNGPLAGLRGKIVSRASRRRFVVEVNFIERGASVLLDDFALVPLMD